MLLIKNGKLYDSLKWVAMVALPAAGTAYFAIAQIWGLPDANEVVGTVVAVDTALGTMLHLSSTAYKNTDAGYDGHIDVTDSGAATMHLSSDTVATKHEIKLKVNKTKSKAKRAPR